MPVMLPNLNSNRSSLLAQTSKIINNGSGGNNSINRNSRLSNRNSYKQANNISLDNSDTSSINDLNYSENNFDSSSTMYKNTPSDSAAGTATNFYLPNVAAANESSQSFVDVSRKVIVRPRRVKLRNDAALLSHSQNKFNSQDDYDNSENNDDDQFNNKSDSINSGSLEMDKVVVSSVPSNSSMPTTRRKKINVVLNAEQIENEIDKLKKENNLLIAEKEQLEGLGSGDRQQKQSSHSFSTSSVKSSSNHELANTSLQASKHFDQKLEHIESYSQIIENATLKMDACVKDMNIVYENYEKIYDDSSAETEEREEMSSSDRFKVTSHHDEQLSVYDLGDSVKQNLVLNSVEVSPKDDLVNLVEDQQTRGATSSRSSTMSLHTNEETASLRLDRLDRYSVTSSTYKSNFRSENENNYLDDSDSVNLEEVKQEIK